MLKTLSREMVFGVGAGKKIRKLFGRETLQGGFETPPKTVRLEGGGMYVYRERMGANLEG